MIGDRALLQMGLKELKEAFAMFAANKQKYPLLYEGMYSGFQSVKDDESIPVVLLGLLLAPKTKRRN